ncbi:NAD-binding protein, partial [Candidatus Woesearchaeota archaeon]|nr:NAD-binding protein [Candidatus Woesearchaeota archaeon]
AAKSIEVLFLLSLSVMFLFSLLATHLGFSIIVGAFISGVALGSLEYNIEIISRIRSLKDFFVTIFFVSLGMEIIFTDLTKVWTVLVVFLALAMIAKPLIIQILSALFGYTKSTGFLTAISLGQVSEFSLVIVSLGLVLGHITPEFFSLTIVLAVITMIFTSYFIKYDNKIMRFMSKPLSIFDAISPTKTGFEYLPEKVKKPDVVLLGCDRVGYKIFEQLTKLKKNIIVVDFNPEIIKELASKRIHCIYGDVGDMDIIERIDLKNAKMIISTVPDVNDNILLVKETRKVNKKGTVITTSFDADDALRLYKEGADYVILPHYLGGEHFSALLEEFEDAESVLKRKLCHIEELKTRRFIHKKPLNGK